MHPSAPVSQQWLVFEKRGARKLVVAGIWVVSLAHFTSPVHAQSVSTVRESEFRSRWTDYQVDRPLKPTATQPNPADPNKESLLSRLTRFGPVEFRGGLTTGWEYSDEQNQINPSRETSKSSFFIAPSVVATYERELGSWNATGRYSVGWLYYLDPNFSGSDGDVTTSQTGGLQVSRQSDRLNLKSDTSVSSGTGFDIDRGAATDRLTFREGFSAEYQLTAYKTVGISGSYSYNKNDTLDNDSAGLDSTDYSYSGAAFFDNFWTDKTAFRIELSAGATQQEGAALAANDRTFVQSVFRVNYSPTSKLIFTGSVGLGVLDETVATSNTNDGLRAVYSLTVVYSPSEKTSIRLYAGVEGAALEPEFTLAIGWHPREFTFLDLSVYRQTGLSNFSTSDQQLSTGFLLSFRQRIFGRVEGSLSGGYEKSSTIVNGTVSSVADEEEPYYFFAFGVGWQINQNLSLQTQYRAASGRNNQIVNQDGLETRSSISLSLTY